MKELVSDNAYSSELDSLIDEKVTSLNNDAYINDYFVRVLINKKTENNNKYIGSKGDGLSIDPQVDGSYYLNSFSWSLLSDVASEKQIKDMLETVDKVLKTEAGYMLCSKHEWHPGFTNFEINIYSSNVIKEKDQEKFIANYRKSYEAKKILAFREIRKARKIGVIFFLMGFSMN